MPLYHAPMSIGHRQLKDVLCQIDRHGCSIHFGLLLSIPLTPHHMTQLGTMMRHKEREESIPSFQRTGQRRRCAVPLADQRGLACRRKHGRRTEG